MSGLKAPEDNFLEEGAPQWVGKDGIIRSAARNGTLPFVAADDIAEMAFRALTDATPHNRDYLVLGPELLTYDQVASILSDVLDRPIVHEHITEEQLRDGIISYGYPESCATMLGSLDTAIANGAEARLSDDVQKVLGRPPISLRDFALKHKGS